MMQHVSLPITFAGDVKLRGVADVLKDGLGVQSDTA